MPLCRRALKGSMSGERLLTQGVPVSSLWSSTPVWLETGSGLDHQRGDMMKTGLGARSRQMGGLVLDVMVRPAETL